jgi:diguanylate cyclase (GGDEF)-like protein
MNLNLLPYIITEGYCVLYALTVLIRINSYIGSQRETRQLRNMIYAYIGMLVFDIFSEIFLANILVPPTIVLQLVNCTTIICVSLGCYFWYRFVFVRSFPTPKRPKLVNILMFVPLVVIIATDIISLSTGWLFYVKDGEFLTTDAFTWVQGVVNYFYLLVPTVYSVYRFFASRSHIEKVESITFAGYMVAPLISGFLEDVVPEVPILALNIFLIIHFLFVMIQNHQIYTDALTNLNNRRHLNEFLEEQLPKASSEKPVVLFMMDINGFKVINDTYGHVEGDNALMLFSDVLKDLAVRENAFAARYGGDEFCLVMTKTNKKPESIALDVRSLLAQKQPSTSKFIITVSIGYAQIDMPKNDSTLLIEKADVALYADKQTWHANNAK